MFYHLGELESALTYALGAGSLLDVNDNSEFAQTIVCELAKDVGQDSIITTRASPDPVNVIREY